MHTWTNVHYRTWWQLWTVMTAGALLFISLNNIKKLKSLNSMCNWWNEQLVYLYGLCTVRAMVVWTVHTDKFLRCTQMSIVYMEHHGLERWIYIMDTVMSMNTESMNWPYVSVWITLLLPKLWDVSFKLYHVDTDRPIINCTQGWDFS